MRFHGGKPPIFRSWSGTPEGSGRISLGISIHVAHVSEALSRWKLAGSMGQTRVSFPCSHVASAGESQMYEDRLVVGSCLARQSLWTPRLRGGPTAGDLPVARRRLTAVWNPGQRRFIAKKRKNIIAITISMNILEILSHQINYGVINECVREKVEFHHSSCSSKDMLRYFQTGIGTWGFLSTCLISHKTHINLAGFSSQSQSYISDQPDWSILSLSIGSNAWSNCSRIYFNSSWFRALWDLVVATSRSTTRLSLSTWGSSTGVRLFVDGE